MPVSNNESLCNQNKLTANWLFYEAKKIESKRLQLEQEQENYINMQSALNQDTHILKEEKNELSYQKNQFASYIEVLGHNE